MTKKSHSTNPTENTDYWDRISKCESHLLDIEILLDGLLLVDQLSTPDMKTAFRVMPFIRLMHRDLGDHAAALRRELGPPEHFEKGSAL